MNHRILIIDDDPMIRHIVESILTSAGHTVVVAEHGEHAVQIMEQEARPITFDLIVCDVMMPGINGIDFVNRMKLHADTQNIPIVMLTAESKSEDIMTGYEVGADYYITKPFTRQQLLYGVSIALGESEDVG